MVYNAAYLKLLIERTTGIGLTLHLPRPALVGDLLHIPEDSHSIVKEIHITDCADQYEFPNIKLKGVTRLFLEVGYSNTQGFSRYIPLFAGLATLHVAEWQMPTSLACEIFESGMLKNLTELTITSCEQLPRHIFYT